MKEAKEMKEKRTKTWLDERRELFVKNIFRDFLRAYSSFLEIERKYREEGITYEGLDDWVGTQADRGQLWMLKDNCHRLWKGVDPKRQPEPFLFDWMVGAIFHEAMKLKENIYMIVRYKPALIAVGVNSGNEKYQQFFEQTLYDVQLGMDRLENLFRHAIEHLESLLLTERKNILFLRFILKERSIKEKMWQKNEMIERILQTMFPKGLDEAYCVAGDNYMEDSWYEEARMSFEEALKINPDCKEAQFGLCILEKRQREIDSIINRDYALAYEECISTLDNPLE